MLLDQSNLNEYVNVGAIIGHNRTDLSKQHLSDIVRTNLIANHGGVWVDATCFCCRPLDEWIHDHTGSGFFAFLGHRKDTPVSNWLLASHKDCYLTSRIRDEVNLFWQENHFPAPCDPSSYKLLSTIINWRLNCTRLWFSFPVLKILKIYPYYWFHYIFAELVKNDDQFRAVWNETPKVDAYTPHILQHYGLLNPIAEEVKYRIDLNADYVYKLSWKLNMLDANYDGDKYPPDSNLGYLLRSLDY